MKKFAKISSIIAGVFFVTGVMILVICKILAGSEIQSEITDVISSKLDEIPDIGFIDFASPWNFYENAWDEYYYYSDDADVYTGKHTDDKAAFAPDITDLYLSLGKGIFTIAPSQDEYFHISSKGKGKCQYYTEGSTFYINAFYESKWYNSNRLTLEIPDMAFDNIDISIGAGSANISSLQGSSIVINVGAGALTIGDLSCEYIEAEIGMGSVHVKNGSIQNAGFDVGMGDLTYTGNIDYDLSAVVGMGSMELTLNDSQNDHNYYVDASMGSITIGNAKHGSFAEFEQDIDNNADSTYSLECGMGSIEIKFKN